MYFQFYWSVLLYIELNASIDALVDVNATVVQLEMLTEILQLELDNITDQTTDLMTMCSQVSNVTTVVCNIIPNISYTVAVDYSEVIVCE